MQPTDSVELTQPAISIQHRNFFSQVPDSWQQFLDGARAIDEAGIDRLVVSDHVVMGENLDAYSRPETGGVVGGKQPTGPDGIWLEPLTTLSVIAGVTSRVRLATGILLAALRRPVVLAKTLSTLDTLSGGRLDVGVGVGWQREEYEAAGMDYQARGRTLDHTLEVVQTLWRHTPADFHSDELDFDGIYLMPKPIQPHGVPIWVSGRLNGPVINRVTRYGNGWIPWGDDAQNPAPGVERLREALNAAGRDTTEVQVVGLLPVKRGTDRSIQIGATMERVPAMVEAGITDFRMQMAVPEDRHEAVDILSEVVAAFRSAAG